MTHSKPPWHSEPRNRRVLAVAAVALIAGAAWLLLGRAKSPRVEGDTAEQRIASISKVALLNTEAAAEAILAVADDPEPAVHRAALAVLGHLPGEKQWPMIRQATRDGDPQVRAGAAATLGLRADDADIDRIGELLVSDPDINVRRAAVTGLARGYRPRATVLLVDAIDRDPPVRSDATAALMAQFKAQFVLPAEDDHAGWKRLAAMIRTLPSVREAYAKAGKP